MNWIAEAWDVYQENYLPPGIDARGKEFAQTLFWAGAQACQMAHDHECGADAAAELDRDRAFRSGLAGTS